MYYLCTKYYKPITVQYYIAKCVSWVSRLTLLGLQKNLDLETRSQNQTHSHAGDFLYSERRSGGRQAECRGGNSGKGSRQQGGHRDLEFILKTEDSS